MRVCNSCKQELSLDNFHRSGDGYQHRCKDCIWAYRLEWLYRLDKDGYNAMIAAQGGLCACCGEIPGEGRTKRPFNVDHWHECCPTTPTCGTCTRALVCHRCNVLIGRAENHTNTLSNSSYINMYISMYVS